jgi:hypothetical protein
MSNHRTGVGTVKLYEDTRVSYVSFNLRRICNQIEMMMSHTLSLVLQYSLDILARGC